MNVNDVCVCVACKRKFDPTVSSAFEVEGKIYCSTQCLVTRRKTSKYRAKRCSRDEIKFPSLLERNCYDVLTQMKSKNELDFFLMQVPFHLPGKSVHRVDFSVFFNEMVVFIEAKGKDLAMGKLKRKQVEDIYGIQIDVVKSAQEIYQLLYKK